MKSLVTSTGAMRWPSRDCREGTMVVCRAYLTPNIPMSSRSTAQKTVFLYLMPVGRAMPCLLIKSLLPTKICWPWVWAMRPLSWSRIFSMGRYLAPSERRSLSKR